MSHRDTVFTAPPGFTALASSTASPVAAMSPTSGRIYGIQFHPEVVHTPYGQQVLRNFLIDICGAAGTWSARSVIEEQIERIREQVGEGRALCALSGGVDSSVAALLVHRAIGDRLTCVFVDHGLMRKNEGDQVVAAFRDHFRVPLVAVDASSASSPSSRAVTDPERKRKIIGNEFIRVFEEEAEPARRHQVPRTGHPLLRCDRIRRRRGDRDDQVPPQCRRSAEDIEFGAGPSRCARCSRTRSARSGPRWGCRSGWSWRQPFPGPAGDPRDRRRGHPGEA